VDIIYSLGNAVLFLPPVFFLKGKEKLNDEGGLDLYTEEGLDRLHIP
jgi:hypothetical protein